MKEGMEILEIDELRKYCPLKWHDEIPEEGVGLGIADIDFAGPKGISEYISSRLSDHYAFYQKREGLKSAIMVANKFLDGKGIRNATVQVIPGTMVGIYTVMKYISKKNGNICVVNPIYPPIHFHASEEGNSIDWAGFDDQGRLDHERLKESVNHNTKLLAISNPNNPTGTLFGKQDFKLIRDLANDYDFLCFSDELYEPLHFRAEHIALGSIEGLQDRTISLFGFSKAYGLAGFRSGFMSLQFSDTKVVQEVVEHLLVAPSPITSFVLEFALGNDNSRKWVKEFRRLMASNTKKASEYLDDNGLQCIRPEGAFFVFPDVKTEDDEKFSKDLLKRKGVEVVPGSLFGPDGKGHVRINCATSEERLFEGLEKIVQFVNSK